MRREGYEFQATCPTVIFKKNDQGVKMEPFELIKLSVDLNIIAKIMDKILKRQGDIIDTIESD